MGSPGQRLKAYIRGRWDRKQGGDVALAKHAGIRRQTLQDWYAGKDTPSLGHLEAVADALGVRRIDLVAAYDGVTAPETTKEPPPEWARDLPDDVAAQVIRRLGDVSQIVRGAAAELGLGEPQPDESQSEEGVAPPGSAGTAPPPKE